MSAPEGAFIISTGFEIQTGYRWCIHKIEKPSAKSKTVYLYYYRELPVLAENSETVMRAGKSLKKNRAPAERSYGNAAV